MTTSPALTTTQIDTVRAHIKKTWKTLTRSHEHLLQSAKDTKLDHKTETPWIVYISPSEDCPNIQSVLERSLSSKDMQRLQIRTLPTEAEAIKEHGLLYLPGPYIVPGGRFNEMYGWDSYFILLGLLRDEEWELAQNQVDQLLYQVQHYGTVLTATRTYDLSPSHPRLAVLRPLARRAASMHSASARRRRVALREPVLGGPRREEQRDAQRACDENSQTPQSIAKADS